ncbi:MAG: hypothetical protein TREMPRED_000675, partial [Tremellales sp. Tagirdzhanova-0007]
VLQALRTELRSLRQLHSLASTWAVTLVDTLEAATDIGGSMWTLELIILEVLQTSLVESENVAGGPFAHFATFLLSLRLSSRSSTPSIVSFVDDCFPLLFDSKLSAFSEILQPSTAVHVGPVLARLIKRSLLTVAAIYPEQDGQSFANDLAEHFMAVMSKQLRRPVEANNHSRTKKTGKTGRSREASTEVQRAVLEDVRVLLVGDEDIKSRWPEWGENLFSA